MHEPDRTLEHLEVHLGDADPATDDWPIIPTLPTVKRSDLRNLLLRLRDAEQARDAAQEGQRVWQERALTTHYPALIAERLRSRTILQDAKGLAEHYEQLHAALLDIEQRCLAKMTTLTEVAGLCRRAFTE